MAEHEFKKGDRVVFVKDDDYAGVEMPEGTSATYVDDDPRNAVPWVGLDTGERVRAWRDSIAPAENHGTGDGSASDICAEPGCNCDLERRFPAPLDPKNVKPGDTVTVRVEPNPDTGWGTLDHGPEAIEVTGKVWLDSGDNPHGPVAKVGVHALGLPNVTLTAHQPAPEPEPEWKPGRFVSVRINGRELPGERYQGFVTHHGTVMVANEDGSPESINLAHLRDVRPLVVIDPATVDVEALQAAIDGANGGAEARAVLQFFGIEVPR